MTYQPQTPHDVRVAALKEMLADTQAERLAALKRADAAEAERNQLREEIATAGTKLADIAKERNEWRWRAEDNERKTGVQRERAEQAEAQLDQSVNRATAAIVAMGADIRNAEHRARRYRTAWQSARERAARRHQTATHRLEVLRQRREQIRELENHLQGAVDAGRSNYRAAMDARDALDRVRALHQQYRFAGDDTTDYCSHCNQISGGWIPWPCPTVRAIDGPEAAPAPAATEATKEANRG